jgi:hypothetical protein
MGGIPRGDDAEIIEKSVIANQFTAVRVDALSVIPNHSTGQPVKGRHNK